MTVTSRMSTAVIAVIAVSSIGVLGTSGSAAAAAPSQARQYPCVAVVTGGLTSLETPLARGSSGEAVRDWQTFLNHWLAVTDRAGDFRLAVDGDFGALTDAVTRELQLDTGRPVDGIVGSATVAGYRSTGVAATTTSAPALLQAGSCGTAVAAWQTRLDRWLATTAPGASPLAVDGVLGPETEAVTTAFQAASGITVDGLVGPATSDAMAAFEHGAGLPDLSRGDAGDAGSGSASAPPPAAAPSTTGTDPGANPATNLGSNLGSNPGSNPGTPAAGICSRPGGAEVVVTLLPDVPSPRCTVIAPEQHLTLRNRTGATVHVSLVGDDRTLAPGEAVEFDKPFGRYLSPGVTTVTVHEYGDSGPQLWLPVDASG